ncbi:pimeloyl-ACP methyl ester carboxylesterase [Crossiella equi]|uniref:Pimeloyl-ACP methyl ester carboxylesterase n=1 Tax=Crossiella equi TaxID=130796 RepID=A0ABS5AMS4_9PSEU|nr:tannase/feruloyl esterase family alpha/beta hydrolase [Crossiella equi]MBP2477877.1 pimeloyl-ACP methyl ester carboxylesterase [Crossiella equi]
MRVFLSRVLPVVVALGLLSVPVPAQAAAPTCAPVGVPEVPGASVLSATASVLPAGTVTEPWAPPVSVGARCEVKVLLRHPGVGDSAQVTVWLPATGWNGRFQGVGGGGFKAGDLGYGLAVAVRDGYAAATTDAGVRLDETGQPRWGLGHPGLLTNFASRSLHDLAVVGKAVTAAHFGRPAAHSYWNGCSTGGRQGLVTAQRYPEDYDGILAGAPAINMPEFLIADLWPQTVQYEAGVRLRDCELAAFTQAAVAACDGDDGVRDGVLEQPLRCGYDPYRLVGTRITCDGKEITISRAAAEVVRRIWAGPPNWYGLPRTADPRAVAAATPFAIADQWVRFFVEGDPGLDTTKLGHADYLRLAARSPALFNRQLANDDPDLSAFRRAGGKLLTWHGWGDQVIFPQGSVRYHERVRAANPGADSFYRLFLAPGVGHCSAGNTGPVPVDPLGALVRWVEQGIAPATLPAASADGTVTRGLCPAPLVNHYDGHGDPRQAASFRCGPTG